jgi:hypothetical protein
LAIGVGLAGLAAVIIVQLFQDVPSSDPAAGPDTSAGDVAASSNSLPPGSEGTATTAPPRAESTTTFPVFDEVGAVEAFVLEFAAAIDREDVDFLYERLHPAVKTTFDESICRTHIESEILDLDGYRQTGPVEGPLDTEFAEFLLTTYEVPVAFDFDGQAFESSASYSLTEGTVRWFAQCG